MSTNSITNSYAIKNSFTFGVIRNRTNKFFEIRKKQTDEISHSKFETNLILNDTGKTR